ncbi:MAG TPA: tripartite tricarboxylate transporter TctB family protein [Devosiaceae bacterium]|jgi:hypothetical protein
MTSRRFEVSPKELVPALFFLATGAFFLINAVFFIGFEGDNGAGSATFPTLISIVLLGIGLILLIRSIRTGGEGFQLLAWPKLAVILISPIVFGFAVRPLGFIPALILSLACASLADTATPIVRRAVVILAITVLCVLVFHYGLRLPFPLVQGWNLN